MTNSLDHALDPRDPAALQVMLCGLSAVETIDRRVREQVLALVGAKAVPDGGVLAQAWRLVEGLFEHIYLEAVPAAPLQNVHRLLMKPVWATLLLAPELLRPDGVVAGCLNDVLAQGLGATESLGRAVDEWLAELARTTAEWSVRFSADEAWWRDLASRLEAVGEQQRARVARLEQRLLDSEMGAMRALRAEYQAVQLINLRCEGRSLPAEIVDFLHGPWRDSLKLICLSDGLQSSAWRDAVRATNNLVRSCVPLEREDQRQQLYKLIDELPAQLSGLLRSLSHQPAQCGHWMDQLSRVHLALLQGGALTWVAVPQLALVSPVQGVALQVQRELQSAARGCSVGQWFLVQSEGEEALRCKLAVWLEDTDSALFTNWLGQRVACHTSDELAVAMASGWMHPLKVCNWFAVALAAVAEQYHLQYLRMLETRQRRASAEQQEAEQLARARAEQEARERARLKAEIETQRLEVLRESAEQQQRAQALQERRQEAEEAVDSLGIGAWVDLELVAGEPRTRAKLAVKMPSTGKMVFVDRVGMKVADVSRDDLLALFAMERATVHRAEARFEDTLVKIVDQMRRDRRDTP